MRIFAVLMCAFFLACGTSTEDACSGYCDKIADCNPGFDEEACSSECTDQADEDAEECQEAFIALYECRKDWTCEEDSLDCLDEYSAASTTCEMSFLP